MHSDIDLISDFICYHQGQIIQHQHSLKRAHELVEKEYKKYKDSNTDITSLKESLLKIVNIGFGDINEIFDSSYKYISELFNNPDISKDKSRMTIKITDSDDLDLYVVDIYRSGDLPAYEYTNIISNTAFDVICFGHDTRYYLENNIFEKYLKGKYKNHRVKEITKQIVEDCRDNNMTWDDCWLEPNQKPKSKFHHYSSTFVIPMTLSNNMGIKSQFIKDFYGKTKDIESFIWGFLCLDHPEKNFFTKFEARMYEKYGFIFADVLSIYVMLLHEYIFQSPTINQVEKIISKKSN